MGIFYSDRKLFIKARQVNREENGYLSNWYISNFIIEGIKFSSMEQYMMYKKAMYFQDNDTAKKILETDDVAKIKSLGRIVKNYDDNYWNGIRQIQIDLINLNGMEKTC